jgi:hypothetical protein
MKGRTQSCTPDDARRRLRHAQQFLDVAHLLVDQETEPEYTSAAAALSVLAGIAASDAACCKALGRRSRGQDHQQAADLLELVRPDGDDAAKLLRRLLGHKDTAHYGLIDLTNAQLKSTLRQADELVDFARRAVVG